MLKTYIAIFSYIMLCCATWKQSQEIAELHNLNRASVSSDMLSMIRGANVILKI